MSRKPIVLTFVAVCMLATGFHAVRSEDPQTPPPEPPESTEVREVPAPLRMMTQDAKELMEQLRERARAEADQAALDEARTPDEADLEVNRVIRIEPAPIVNFAPHFLFRDVTDRETVAPRLTLEQRQARVEAIRQSLARGRKKGAKSRSE